MLESTRRTLTSGSSGGQRWTFYNVSAAEVRCFTAVRRPAQSRGGPAPPQLRDRRAGALPVSSGNVQGTPTLNAGTPLRPLYCVPDRLSSAAYVQTHTTTGSITSTFPGSRSV